MLIYDETVKYQTLECKDGGRVTHPVLESGGKAPLE